MATTSAPCSRRFEAKVCRKLWQRREPCGLGVALHFLLNRFHREGVLGAFAVPKDIPLRPRPWMLLQTLLDTGHGIGRHVHAPIFGPLPCTICKACCSQSICSSLRAATSETRRPQRRITRNSARSIGWAIWAKSRWTCSRERALGRGARAGQSGLASRDSRAPAAAHAKGKKVLQRIQAPVDRRPRPAVVMLAFHKLVDLTKGDLGEGTDPAKNKRRSRV